MPMDGRRLDFIEHRAHSCLRKTRSERSTFRDGRVSVSDWMSHYLMCRESSNS
jgi:hypothetical protein